MNEGRWLDEIVVIGRMPAASAAEHLRAVGEVAAADALEAIVAVPATTAFRGGGLVAWPFRDRAWQHTAHTFGYLRPDSGNALVEPVDASRIDPDLTLRYGRIRVTLDRLRVADYPGGGMHNILFDFYAQNQVPGAVEHVHFNATFRVREGERAAVAGYPIFVGLNVGSDGVAFRCSTINIKNEDDENLLGFLESDVFRSGLRLATAAQPAVAPLSAMAYNLTKTLAKRNRNVPVQAFHLGLDFSQVVTGARLAEGSYIAVQIPEALTSVWAWTDWIFDRASGQLVRRENRSELIPYNYIVFGITKFGG